MSKPRKIIRLDHSEPVVDDLKFGPIRLAPAEDKRRLSEIFVQRRDPNSYAISYAKSEIVDEKAIIMISKLLSKILLGINPLNADYWGNYQARWCYYKK